MMGCHIGFLFILRLSRLEPWVGPTSNDFVSSPQSNFYTNVQNTLQYGQELKINFQHLTDAKSRRTGFDSLNPFPSYNAKSSRAGFAGFKGCFLLRSTGACDKMNCPYIHSLPSMALPYQQPGKSGQNSRFPSPSSPYRFPSPPYRFSSPNYSFRSSFPQQNPRPFRLARGNSRSFTKKSSNPY